MKLLFLKDIPKKDIKRDVFLLVILYIITFLFLRDGNYYNPEIPGAFAITSLLWAAPFLILYSRAFFYPHKDKLAYIYGFIACLWMFTAFMIGGTILVYKIGIPVMI